MAIGDFKKQELTGKRSFSFLYNDSESDVSQKDDNSHRPKTPSPCRKIVCTR